MHKIDTIENIVISKYTNFIVDTPCIFLIKINGKIRKLTINFIENLKSLNF